MNSRRRAYAGTWRKHALWHIAMMAFMLALPGATLVAEETPASPEGRTPKNVILMISDGIGFNGWLATDYYQHGRAGANLYQNDRMVNGRTYPVRVHALTSWSLNFVNEAGQAIPAPRDGSVPEAVLRSDGTVRVARQGGEEGYTPSRMWTHFAYHMEGDFPGNSHTADLDGDGQSDGIAYTSYTDSAASITAFATGEKTTVGRINQDPEGNNLLTIGQLFKEAGGAVGTVSSVHYSHATPAGVAAHNRSRRNYAEIANEMVASGVLDVIIGPGHPLYDDNGRRKREGSHYHLVGGEETWEQIVSGTTGYTFIETREGFELLARHREAAPDRLLGIPQVARTLQANRSRSNALPSYSNPSGDPFINTVPSLGTLSTAALNVLSRNEQGFFVMIEGGAVDWMNHGNNLPRMIEEQIDFNRAVDAVVQWVEQYSSWEETLLIVTADHETGGIWGARTFTNGIGEQGKSTLRYNPATDRFERFEVVRNAGIGVLPAVQYATGNHTNKLVPLWAIGAGSERFAELVKHDPAAALLWGKAYRWDGSYVDNTDVFRVMTHVLQTSDTVTVTMP